MKTTLLLATFSFLFGLFPAKAQIVIVNSSVRVTEISKSDLSDIFTGGSTHFKDGSHAIPVTLKSGPTHESFLKEYIGRPEKLFRGSWMALVFAGQANMPEAFNTEAELLRFIESKPGAIGYIGKPEESAKIRVLTVK